MIGRAAAISAALFLAAASPASSVGPNITNPVGTWVQHDGVVAVITYFRTRDHHVRWSPEGYQMPDAENDPAAARILFVNSTPEHREGALECWTFAFTDVGDSFEEPVRFDLAPGETVEITVTSENLNRASSMMCLFEGWLP